MSKGKEDSSPTKVAQHRLLTRPRSESAPQLGNQSRTQLLRRGGSFSTGGGNQAMVGLITKVTHDVEALVGSPGDEERMESAQSRTDSLFGIQSTQPETEKPPPFPKKQEQSTTAKGWKQFKRRLGEFFGTKGTKESAARRERALTQKYGIAIGPQEGEEGVHMSHTMLDRLEKVLDQLPKSHVSGNRSLVKISEFNDPDIGSASAFSPDTKSIGITRPQIPGTTKQLPGWLYSILNPYWKWQRNLMDKQITSEHPGWSKEDDEKMGVDSKQRSTMAGDSELLAQENLLQNTVRHEVGHAVDEQIGWEERESGQEMFGGWKKHLGEDGAYQVARAFLTKVGLDPEEEVTKTKMTAFYKLGQAIMMFGEQRNYDYLNKLDQQLDGSRPLDLKAWVQDNPDKARKFAEAAKSARLGMAEAWHLPDGGGDRVLCGDRKFHVDYHGQWVSYLAAERAHVLSNYQFSSPGEWFAEAYTAYYNPSDPKPSAKLRPDVRQWFLETLGAPKQKGQKGRNESFGSLSMNGKLEPEG